MNYKHRLLVIASIAACYGNFADARVTRFVVEDRSVIAEGRSWGAVGAYEKLIGTAFMEVDPRDPLNAVIVNLDKAPRNARGMVEFSSPFVILKPLDMAKGNRKIWFGLNNRGNCIELPVRSFPLPAAAQRSCNPSSVEQIGANNVLLNEGYAWVDAGWHGDGVTPADRSRLYPTFPVAKNSDGSAIVGVNRLEFQVTKDSFSLPFVMGFRAYEAADLRTSAATLTVRDRADGPVTQIAADQWAFATCPEGKDSQTPSNDDICLFDGFKARKIYELVYRAKDPIVMGLAHAVPRDIGSFLRSQLRDDAGNPNPLAATAGEVGIRRAYLSGTSSTGMYMREFLYLGFNEDEAHRKVFDGVTVYSGGSHRLFANVQFASPTFYAGQDQHHDYTSNSIAPFTFAVTTDPITGIKDGILKRPATDPYVLQIDEELVFWQWKASLNVVDGAGHPVPVPPNVRLYLLGGWGHISAAGLLAPPSTALAICAHPTQGDGAMASIPRALVKVIDDWADRGVAPPKSRYPTLQDGTLVSLAQYREQFPKIPGLEPPSVMNTLTALDFGPEFSSTGGVQTLHPPRVPANAAGAEYQVFVPKPGPNGDPVAGVDTIWTRAPLGSNVGWNLNTAPRDPDLCTLAGSYVPLANSKKDRLANNDPRPSLEERYKNHQGFVKAVKKASIQLVSERFLLQEDADALLRAAQESDVLKAGAVGK